MIITFSVHVCCHLMWTNFRIGEAYMDLPKLFFFHWMNGLYLYNVTVLCDFLASNSFVDNGTNFYNPTPPICNAAATNETFNSNILERHSHYVDDPCDVTRSLFHPRDTYLHWVKIEDWPTWNTPRTILCSILQYLLRLMSKKRKQVHCKCYATFSWSHLSIVTHHRFLGDLLPQVCNQYLRGYLITLLM